MSSDAAFTAELIEEFRRTSRERLERVAVDWVAIEKNPKDVGAIEELRRELHSLKGEARMVGYADASRLAHRTEELVAFTAARNFANAEAAGDLLLAAADALDRLLQAMPGEPIDADAHSKLLARFSAFMVDAKTAGVAATQAHTEASPTVASAGESRGSDASLRVDAGFVAWLAEAAGEAIVAYTRHERAISVLRTLSEEAAIALAELDTVTSHPAVATLQRFHHELTSVVEAHAQRIHDGVLHTRQMEHRTRLLRLVPIRSLFDRYIRAVRDLAREQNKHVRLVITDNDVTIDKVVVDALAEPLLHLLRNSLDHGIETVEERVQKGKPPEACIELSARQSEGYVAITVSDDGRGIDQQLVRRRAADLGLMSEMAATRLTDEDAFALLFRSGFSTKRDVTELSGRGVGLSVVKHQVILLGGSVQIESTPGAGTRFELKTPISVALTHVLVIASDAALFAVPAAGVLGVSALDKNDIMTVGAKPHLRFRDDWVPLCDFSTVMGVNSSETPQRVVVVAHDGNSLALGISAWHAETEAVIKPLGPLFANTPMISGACVLEEGDLALVLNLAELVEQARHKAA